MFIIRQEICRIFPARPRSQQHLGTTLVDPLQRVGLLGFCTTGWALAFQPASIIRPKLHVLSHLKADKTSNKTACGQHLGQKKAQQMLG